MKRKIKIFLKTVYITSVLCLCLFIGVFGCFKSYENIRLIGFGEYRSAIEYENGVIKIFDFEFNINKNS
jgi:hypothetical protein